MEKKCHGLKDIFSCEKCQNIIDDKQFFCDNHEFQRNNTIYITKIVKDLLKKQDEQVGQDNRYRESCNIFDFLVYNRFFVNTENERFNGIVIKTIERLSLDPYICENEDRKNRFEKYKKYFIWQDIGQINNDCEIDKTRTNYLIKLDTEKIEI